MPSYTNYFILREIRNMSSEVMNSEQMHTSKLSNESSRKKNMERIRKSLASCLVSQKKSLQIVQTRKRKGSIASSALLSLDETILEDVFHQNYIVLDKIGEGAHGVVKKCRHRESNKEYAVKIQKLEAEHIYFLKTNFQDVRKLIHPNIIKYKGIYFDFKKSLCYLVMELVDFPNILECKISSEEQFRDIFQKILDALAFMHEKFICHRDIKPENILYDVNSKNLKIIDFGVAKNTKLRGRYEEMLTVTGTEQYRAPQMFLGGGYTDSVDLWAVGITLYRLIAGNTPFENQYHHETIENILHQDIDFQKDQALKSSSYLLRDFISRLLKKKRSERLTCKEAQEHVWFTNSTKNNLFTQSVEYQSKNQQHIQANKIQENRHHYQHHPLKRLISFQLCSLEQIEEEKPTEIGHSKIFVKRWVSQIKEAIQISKNQIDQSDSYHWDMNQEESIGFMSEEISNPFELIKSKSVTENPLHQQLKLPKHHNTSND